MRLVQKIYSRTTTLTHRATFDRLSSMMLRQMVQHVQKSTRFRPLSLIAVIVWFAIGGLLLTFIAAGAALAQSESRPLLLLDAVVHVLDWSNVLLFGREFYVASARTFLINAAGWSLAGIAVAAWRMRRPTPGPPTELA